MTHTTPSALVARDGTINTPGYHPTTAVQFLHALYSAEVIGDDTGITPPGGV